MDRTPTADLLSKLGLEEITSALGTRRLRCHVCRSSDFGGIKRRVVEVEVVTAKLVKKDILERSLSDEDPMVKLVWRAAVNDSRLLPTPETGSIAAV